MDFKLMKISFCDRMADNIVTTENKKFILDILKDKYDINIQKKYALILNEKNIKFVQMNPHLITVKTAGSNYYLFLTKVNDVNCCFFIDRKIKQGYSYPRIISVKYRFSDSMFNDTLFDGELVKDKDNNWMFLLNDLVMSQGEVLKGNIVAKYNKMYEIFKNEYKYDSNFDVCPLRIKKVFTYEDYDKLLTQFIPSLTYKIRGLYFNTLNTRHANFLFLSDSQNNNNNNRNTQRRKNQKNTHHFEEEESVTQTNNKPVDKNKPVNTTKKEEVKIGNLVFELRKSTQPEIYDLYGMKDGELKKQGVAHVSGLRASKKIKSFFKTCETPKVECQYVDKFKKYEPINISNSEISNF